MLRVQEQVIAQVLAEVVRRFQSRKAAPDKAKSTVAVDATGLAPGAISTFFIRQREQHGGAAMPYGVTGSNGSWLSIRVCALSWRKRLTKDQSMTAPPCDLCSMKWFHATPLEPLWPMPSSTASAITGTSVNRLARRASFRLNEASQAGSFTECVRKCGRAFPAELYRQRVHAETVFSAVKRKLSAKAPGRSLATQRKQALLLGLAYNIYKLRPLHFGLPLYA